MCDGQGVPLAVAIGPGQQHDLKLLCPTLQTALAAGRPRRLLADKAYSAAWVRAWLARRSITPVIPTRVDQARCRFDRRAYRRRNVVERLVGWLKESRRVATRYDKLAVTYLTFVKVAMLRRLLRMAFPNAA